MNTSESAASAAATSATPKGARERLAARAQEDDAYEAKQREPVDDARCLRHAAQADNELADRYDPAGRARPTLPGWVKPVGIVLLYAVPVVAVVLYGAGVLDGIKAVRELPLLDKLKFLVGR